MAGLAPQRMNDKQKRIRLQPLIFIGWRLGRRGCGDRIFRLCCSALAGTVVVRMAGSLLCTAHSRETLRSEGNRTQQQETTTTSEKEKGHKQRRLATSSLNCFSFVCHYSSSSIPIIRDNVNPDIHLSFLQYFSKCMFDSMFLFRPEASGRFIMVVGLFFQVFVCAEPAS